MSDVKIIETIRGFKKNILTVAEIGKILSLNDKSLRTIINRLKKKGVLALVGRGLYSVYGESVIAEEVASILYHPSYLSLKTVLSKAGVYNQIPREIYCVTSRKTYKTKINGIPIIYRQIKKELFFGYYQKKKSLIAYPEKAFLDLLYFVSKGRETVFLEELDISSLNKTKLADFSKKYPKEVKKLLNRCT